MYDNDLLNVIVNGTRLLFIVLDGYEFDLWKKNFESNKAQESTTKHTNGILFVDR
jgi:hypothetical protein